MLARNIIQEIDLNSLLRQSDFLSIDTDLSTDSFHLIQALNSKMIAGDALDLFENEPIPHQLF